MGKYFPSNFFDETAMTTLQLVRNPELRMNIRPQYDALPSFFAKRSDQSSAQTAVRCD